MSRDRSVGVNPPPASFIAALLRAETRARALSIMSKRLKSLEVCADCSVQGKRAAVILLVVRGTGGTGLSSIPGRVACWRISEAGGGGDGDIFGDDVFVGCGWRRPMCGSLMVMTVL